MGSLRSLQGKSNRRFAIACKAIFEGFMREAQQTASLEKRGFMEPLVRGFRLRNRKSR
jgi:hypothetical protein